MTAAPLSGPGAAALAAILSELATARMPFGKFGPQQRPPHGLLLIDLPYEYLAWLRRQGFPKGRLGELMAFVYQVKQDGAEALFEPLRGGRPAAAIGHRHQPRRWAFPDDTQGNAPATP